MSVLSHYIYKVAHLTSSPGSERWRREYSAEHEETFTFCILLVLFLMNLSSSMATGMQIEHRHGTVLKGAGNWDPSTVALKLLRLVWVFWNYRDRYSTHIKIRKNRRPLYIWHTHTHTQFRNGKAICSFSLHFYGNLIWQWIIWDS